MCKPPEPEKAPPRQTRLGQPLLKVRSRNWPVVVVAATGPSLHKQHADAVKRSGVPVVAVNDAWRMLPWADVLYAVDEMWWKTHDGCPDFTGEKWSSHTLSGRGKHNDKADAAKAYGLHLVEGANGDGFSLDRRRIHYGSNSGFQGVNMAIHLAAERCRIVLIGFDMQAGKKRHFFGDHPAPLRNTCNYGNFIKHFDRAAKMLPGRIEVVNATPGSALKCFPHVRLEEALHG